MAVVRHVPLETWLNALGLPEYAANFKNSKYQGVEELLELSERDIKELGIRIQSHRARIVSSLVLLREKLNKLSNNSQGKENCFHGGSPCHSNRSSPTPPDTASDYVALQMPYQCLSGLQARPLPCPLRENPEARNMQRFLWYHGNIPRDMAEARVISDGDFLVRDSISKPGDFVLTCCRQKTPLHFVINKQAYTDFNGHYKIQYQFEEELFDSVPELIEHYVKTKKVISITSQAFIVKGVRRIIALDAQDTVVRSQLYANHLSPARRHRGPSPLGSPLSSPRSTPPSSPPVHRKFMNRRSGSQPLLSLDDPIDNAMTNGTGNCIGRHGSMPLICPDGYKLSEWTNGCSRNSDGSSSTSSPEKTAYEPHSAEKNFSKRPPNGLQDPALLSGSSIHAACFVTDATAAAHYYSNGAPPPKPSRVPTVKLKGKDRPVVQKRNQSLYDDDGADYTDYAQVKRWPPQASPNMDRSAYLNSPSNRKSQPANTGDYDIPKPPKSLELDKKSGSTSLGRKPSIKDLESPRAMTLPNSAITSRFDVKGFSSEILTKENKPLENQTMITIKALLLEGSPKVLAQHITDLDLELLMVTGNHDLGVGVHSGLELITLPQGSVVRQDILERFHCMRLFVALTVLICNKHTDRARMISQWIQVAMELRAHMGDLFGFSAILEGLSLMQVTRLKSSWTSMQQNFPKIAQVYDTKLKSLLTSLNAGGSMLPLTNITVPHILPLVQLLEFESASCFGDLPWEDGEGEGGLEAMLAHLDTARIVTAQYGLYRVTAENCLKDFIPSREITDMFRTEMHMKLLWGNKGASAKRADRYHKFGLLLSALSERAEPSQVEPNKGNNTSKLEQSPKHASGANPNQETAL